MGTTWIMFSNGLSINSNDARNRMHPCIRLLYRIGSRYSEAIRMKVKTAEDLFKALVKAGVFMNTEDGVKAFAQLLITLNKKYPGWSK